jgi:hypothetical protein
VEAQCFPTGVDDLKPVLELAAEFKPAHINLQPNAVPSKLIVIFRKGRYMI